MTLMVLGLLLWCVPHLFKRLAPEARARMGDRAKGGVAVLVLAGVVLMVIGYRGAEFVNVWYPPAWTQHLNNLMMLFSVALFGLGSSKSPLRSRLRHPMLLGMLTWAVAHLLVNGDLASIVLFGVLGIWAVMSIVAINAREPNWERWQGGSTAGTVRLVAISIVVYAVIAGIHWWLGVNPFPG